jgi:hypothetical protein
MVKHGAAQVTKEELLKHKTISLAARGEGTLFYKEGNADDSNTTWWEYGAAMKVTQQAAQVTCERSLLSCSPSTHCETSGISGCVMKTTVSTDGWWEEGTYALEKALAPSVTSGSSTSHHEISGIAVNIYCGKKSDFGENQGSEPNATTSMLECLQAGVQSNAALRATSPWKLFFPEEVVAMAVFSKIDNANCELASGAKDTSEPTLCNSATKVDNLGAHLLSSSKTSAGGTYQGLRTGAGWPKGAVSEVVMRPEDILQAAGVIAGGA